MSRFRALVVVTAALAAVLPRGVEAATPALPLAGQVTVSGRTAGYVPVTLPYAVDFRADGGREFERPSATFTGGAYGWLLLTAKSERGWGFAGATRVPSALGGSTEFRIDGTDPRSGERLANTATLPAGTYRLYLLTSGPGGVTFRLPGLRGTTALGVTTRAAATATTLVAPTVNGVAPNAYANGVTFGGDTPTLALSYHYFRSTAQAAAQFGWCTYRDGPPAGQWVPGCPGADIALVGAYGAAVGCCGIGTGGGLFDRGRWGYGRFYLAAGAVEHAVDHFVVVPLH